MRIIIDSSGVGYLREAKMRLNNKSHLLKTGLTTIQRNYSIINLLKSFYRLANLNLKFGIFPYTFFLTRVKIPSLSSNVKALEDNHLTSAPRLLARSAIAIKSPLSSTSTM